MEKQDWSNQLSKRASPTRIFTVRDTNNYLPANPTRPTGPTNYLLFKMRLLDIDRTFPFIQWGKLLPLIPIKNDNIIISMKWLYSYRKYTFLRRNWKCVKYVDIYTQIMTKTVHKKGIREARLPVPSHHV